MSHHQRQLSQQTDNTTITTVKRTIPDENQVDDSVDLEMNHSIKPTIFSITISFLLIASSLGLAIWSFVIFTKNKDAYKQQEQYSVAQVKSEFNNYHHGSNFGHQQLFGEEFALDNNGTQSMCNETRTRLLQNMFRRDVLVIAISDLLATCLSIGSVIILLIQLVKTSRKMFNEDDDDESFYDKLNMEKENAATRFSVDASSSKRSLTTNGATLEVLDNATLQRQSSMVPTSNYKIKEKSLWTRLEEDHYLLFIISCGLTLCRIITGIISLSFTIVLSSELNNECIIGMFANSLTTFDSVIPFTYTQYGVIVLVFLIIPINHIVLYFWLKKNSRVYRYIVGLSRRFERDEE